MKQSQAHWESFFNKFYWVFLQGAPSKRRCLKIFRKLGLPKSAEIIEMGCGTGFFLRRLQKDNYYNLWGLDFSAQVLEPLSKTGIKAVCTDAKKSGFKNNYFDLVFSDGVLEHFQSPQPFLKEFARISKDYLVTIVPRPTWQNKIESWILRPPKEYHRSTKQWEELHRQLGFEGVKSLILGRNCLMIICRKKLPINLNEGFTN
jgi:ubiquinone/menaquinone biosynthesis C-methylase UbiE